MSIDNLRYIIKRISNPAGIKKSIHPHQLSHSYATHMINNDAPLEVIQSLLGDNDKVFPIDRSLCSG